MAQTTTDQQSARRKAVMWMFVGLLLGVVGLVVALIFAAHNSPSGNNSQFIQGIVLTAIAGAISALLSFMGLIVKRFFSETSMLGT